MDWGWPCELICSPMSATLTVCGSLESRSVTNYRCYRFYDAFNPGLSGRPPYVANDLVCPPFGAESKESDTGPKILFNRRETFPGRDYDTHRRYVDICLFPWEKAFDTCYSSRFSASSQNGTLQQRMVTGSAWTRHSI